MRAPWHLWLIGLVSLIWNGFAAADYVMTQIQFEPYMSQFTDIQREYFSGFPKWVQGSWALAVWLSVLGSIFLLLRLRYAGACFGLALIFMAATFVHNFILAEVRMSQIAGTEALWFSLAIAIIAILLWIYARAMRRRGVLA
ncbi:MAG: hypothetical protein ACR2O1_06630 [Boseongicola sp.]